MGGSCSHEATSVVTPQTPKQAFQNTAANVPSPVNETAQTGPETAEAGLKINFKDANCTRYLQIITEILSIYPQNGLFIIEGALFTRRFII